MMRDEGHLPSETRLELGTGKTNTRLTLLDSVDLQTTRAGLTHLRCQLCPNNTFVGILSDKVLLRVYEPVKNRLQTSFVTPLPSSVLKFALHPDGERIALATPQQIQIIHHRDDTITLRGIDPARQQVRSLLFSRDGAVLWASVEDHLGVSHIQALDTATLEPLASAPVTGIIDSQHNLSAHPTREAIAVEVSCGQDGTWVSFVELTGHKLKTIAPGLTREHDPLFLAGFAGSGESFATINDARICKWSWPACDLLAKTSIVDNQWTLHWQGAAMGDNLYLPLADEEMERFKLLILHGETLELISELDWKRADQSHLVGVYPLANQTLLMVGDRRAGMFKIESC